MLDVDGQPCDRRSLTTVASSVTLLSDARRRLSGAFKRGRNWRCVQGALHVQDFGELHALKIGLGQFNHLQFKWPSSSALRNRLRLYSQEKGGRDRKKNSFHKFLVIVDVSQLVLDIFSLMSSMKDAQLILTDTYCTTDIQDLSCFQSTDVINF